MSITTTPTTDDILKKLNNQSCTDHITWDKDWTKEEQKQLLKIYYLITKNETKLFDLVYSYHECDSYEDIFRDYDYADVIDKTDGVRTALKNAKRSIKHDNENIWVDAVSEDGDAESEGEGEVNIDDGDMDDMNYTCSISDVSTITNSDYDDDNHDDTLVDIGTNCNNDAI